MIRMETSVCIAAPAPAVWAVVSDLASVHLWVDAVKQAHCQGLSRGVGARRVCELRTATIRETIVEWTEGESFRYRVDGAPLMKSGTNFWTVTPHGQDTLVTSTAEVELRGGAVGSVLEAMLSGVFRRMGNHSLACLKYLIEHGEPYRGSVRKLLPLPANC